MQMDNLLKAYLAGIIDGEGYIGIGKANKKEQKSPYYRERVSVGISSKVIVDIFYEYFGGSISYRDRIQSKFNSNQPYWVWEITDKKAAEFCHFFAPSLIVKRPQALLLCKLRESKEKGQLRRKERGLLTRELLLERESYYQQIISLHGRKRTDYSKKAIL